MKTSALPVHALHKMWDLSEKNVSLHLGGIFHQTKKNLTVTSIFFPCNFILSSVMAKK